MKAVKRLYTNKTQTSTNPFTGNHENRFPQAHNMFNSVAPKSSCDDLRIGDVKRKRKFNDMMCDSPVSSKSAATDQDEEEEKHVSVYTEDRMCEEYSRQLLNQLKTIPSEEDAFHLIKNYMKTYKTRGGNGVENNQNMPQKKKYSDKDKKLVADAIKKLSTDNVTLKKAVRKFVEREEKTAEKVKQFDNLGQAYNKLATENQKLKEWIGILQFAAKEKCDDKLFSDFNPSNFNGNGGPGVC